MKIPIKHMESGFRVIWAVWARTLIVLPRHVQWNSRHSDLGPLISKIAVYYTGNFSKTPLKRKKKMNEPKLMIKEEEKQETGHWRQFGFSKA